MNNEQTGRCPICNHPLSVVDKGEFTNAPFSHNDDIEYLSLFCTHCGASVIVNGCKRNERHNYDYYKCQNSQN